jgi:hypothetical protein
MMPGSCLPAETATQAAAVANAHQPPVLLRLLLPLACLVFQPKQQQQQQQRQQLEPAARVLPLQQYLPSLALVVS